MALPDVFQLDTVGVWSWWNEVPRVSVLALSHRLPFVQPASDDAVCGTGLTSGNETADLGVDGNMPDVKDVVSAVFYHQKKRKKENKEITTFRREKKGTLMFSLFCMKLTSCFLSIRTLTHIR